MNKTLAGLLLGSVLAFSTPKADDAALGLCVEHSERYQHARITYTLPEDGRAQLQLYNLQGKLDSTLVDSVLTKGTHVFELDAGSKCGIYFCNLIFGKEETTGKVTLNGKPILDWPKREGVF